MRPSNCSRPSAGLPSSSADVGALAALLDRIVAGGVALTTRALTEAIPGFDLTFPQWRALLVVGEGEDGATISAVAARVGVTVPATSRLLQRLARRGLLRLEQDARDRRAVRVRLTDEGARLRERIVEFRLERIAQLARTIERTAVPGDAERLLAEIAAIFDRER